MVVEWGLVQSVSIDDVVWQVWSILQDVLKNELVQLHLDFGHWQDNITGWELKVSVQLMYSWTSTYVLQGYRLGAVGVVPLENQVNILIFQFCRHITFHMIYEWLNCAISRPVYGPKHSWAISDCGILLDGWRWYLNLKGFLKCRLPCRIKH